MHYTEVTIVGSTLRPLGWGADVDLANNPTYPMRERLPDEQGYSWERPPQQPVTVTILHSNERPNVTAVFGTSSPPSGLSGLLRRFAYRYSESNNLHWVPLMLADRVNMLEGIVSDIGHGRLPNVFKEAGWGVQWRYEKGRLLRRVSTMAAISGVLAAPLVIARRRPGAQTAADGQVCATDVPLVVGDIEAGRYPPVAAD